MQTLPQKKLLSAIQNEGQKFQECYEWLEKTMPPHFFEDVSQENLMLIAHSLMGFDLQQYFSTIQLKSQAIVVCLDSPDADLKVLSNYAMFGIKHYQGYVSNSPPPFAGIHANLRISVIYFTEAIETVECSFPLAEQEKLWAMVKERNPSIQKDEFAKLMTGINTKFLLSMSLERLVLALDMFFRAKTRDNCQYEVRYEEDWEEKGTASMQIVLAWRNTPKHNFLYRLARTINRHGLMMKRVHATYIAPYESQNILIMSLDLHGSDGKAAWDAAAIPEFLRELVTVKYFSSSDLIDEMLVCKEHISGNMANFLRAALNFVHQTLLHVDPYLYTLENIEQDLCRHPEFTSKITLAMRAKFDPDFFDRDTYQEIRSQFLVDIHKLDTGNEENDTRRKNVLIQGMNFVHYMLKTNFYRMNMTAFSFRLDPKYLDEVPFDRTKKFPELPYAVFFFKGMHFFGFHIRFKDLARGGLRTVFLEQSEHLDQERNQIFSECYQLALTQHKKNKDIPEGGAKGIIFLKPYARIDSEAKILKNELEDSKIPPEEIERKITLFQKEQKLESLYQAQRSFIESFLTILNCEPDGILRARRIVDYWKRPEYIYLGPDENMHDSMIEWIANFSAKYGYKPGSSFMSSKPHYGINHKEYGVTSLGVNVYMEEALKYMGIDPSKDSFTIKMSGGPDGDVAGNQIVNLYKLHKKTAKLTALIDVSGTIHDDKGLNLEILADLFKQGKPLRYYPPEKLSDGGFLVDKSAKRNLTAFVQQTLCWRKTGGSLTEDWLSSSEMNQLLRSNVNQSKVDIFIPGGGRPKTLNETNIKEFLDETGKPTARAIVEGANLYLTPRARHMLEKLGVLVIKDSSANKTGVICSSFEVLCGLALGEEKMLANKQVLVQEILERLKACARNEARLLLETHKKTGEPLTEISEMISERINLFTYQILDYLDLAPLPTALNHPLIQCFFDYCPPLLRDKYQNELLKEIPEHHKKAIIACHIAAGLVYQRGLSWEPTIIDTLPVLLKQKECAL